MAESVPIPKPAGRFTRLRRIGLRILQAILALAALYLLIVLIGLIPVNNGFEPAGDADGHDVYFVSNSVHSDILVPIDGAGVDWRALFPDEAFPAVDSSATYLAIGWGDRGFYLRTRTWADLKLSTAAYAFFWPSETCLHVARYRREQIPESAVKTRISPEQLRSLADFIRRSARVDESGKAIAIPDETYGYGDAFFEAQGSYHALNTCNSWLGRAMKSSGVRTCWLSPLPKTPLMWLPKDGKP